MNILNEDVILASSLKNRASFISGIYFFVDQAGAMRRFNTRGATVRKPTFASFVIRHSSFQPRCHSSHHPLETPFT
ncbi:MAG TPA: hypothetical protein VFE47_02210 [Tepidisphaeraceae bacterium]|jgi:hypothetical protein|nr:hypothetical protein [Tepidisphaeraceae bacterium]